MRTRLVRILLGTALLTTSLMATAPSAQAAYDWTALDARLQQAVTRGEAPTGLALVLTNNDGTVVYRKAFGLWDIDQSAGIASSTKLVVAATLMTLVDDGDLGLDDLVVDYLPSFDDADPAKGTISIRQLLAHTSGLPRSHPCFYLKTISLQDCVDQISLAPLQFTPGAEFSYGGSGYQVAARVAEVITGEVWTNLVDDRVVTPCGMSFSYDDTKNPWVAGGGTTTLDSFDDFLGIFRTDGACGANTVLTSGAIDEMYADQTEGASITESPYMDGRRYGIGLFRDRVDASDNALQVSHAGLFGANPWIELDRGFTGFLIMSSEFHLGKRTHDAILPLIDAQLGT